MPQFSIITPTYNTSASVLARTWASLKAQTLTSWEWVVIDDSAFDEVGRQIYGYQSDERYQVSYYENDGPAGNIGKIKRDGFFKARGDYLVELDHDDELTPTALEDLERAFRDDSVGFVFSDWCELFANGESGYYPDGWALGYGRRYWELDVKAWGLSISTITAKSLAHIVGVPNHVRAWRADTYRQLGGHNPDLPVADDYELIIRTALTTNWVHVPKVLYKQHVGDTTQRQRNAEIQSRVADIYETWKPAIEKRFK